MPVLSFRFLMQLLISDKKWFFFYSKKKSEGKEKAESGEERDAKGTVAKISESKVPVTFI